MMGHYNFDQIIDRTHSDSIKHTFDPSKGKTPDMIPLWVADMDFKSADEIIERIRQRAEHGVFGYTRVGEGYIAAVQNWFKHRFQWEVQEEWMLRTPGVVYAISAAISAFTQEGDAVLIQSPVYQPFAHSIEDSGRKTVRNSLIFDGKRYTVDFDDFEKKIIDEHVKLFILCSPHNPVGRVWTKEELTRMGEICLKHHVTVVSDEIHCDFVWKDHVHIPFASINDAFKNISVICTAPSKTFNIAGLKTSNIFIPNPELRQKFKDVLNSWHCSEPAIFGLTACQAAYECGETWLEEVKEYLQENVRKTMEFFERQIPQVKVVQPEGTYLLWLDCRGIPVPPEKVDAFILEKAKVWLNDGSVYGPEGVGFERMNLGSPWPVLEKACKQIAESVKELKS